jgi:hypothetical protein
MLIAASMAGVLAAGAAMAASPLPAGRAAAVQTVLDCQKVEDGVQRLACFDAAVAAMVKAEAAGDLVTVDREQRRAARHQAFGLTLPSLAFLDRGEKPEEVDRITAKVASASRDPYGKWTIKLDDGAIWRQTDDNQVVRAPHPGSTAEIRKGALGSFNMKLDGQFPIKVHRDN